MSDTAHTAPRNTELRALFDELMELDDAQRAQRLASLTSGQREALAPLLHHAHQPVALLSVPAVEVLHSWREHDLLSERLLGQHIGSFEVLSLLGQGGSSVVLRAQRAAGSAMQVVALKVLRTGVFTAEARWRFAREQAILTQLDHPNIARLIEGGISTEGLPYFAMELVDGEPITAYADRHALSLSARIALMATLCRAVEAAHSTMVVHRDLKPSNVLVTREGMVKVLDFGIAKSLDDSAPQHITLAIMLTPEYAAPEQFRPGPITTATDVYALGVLLGELLTGHLLGAAPTLRASSIVSTHRASLRGLPDSATLARMLRGDLDAIIATAMAEEPTRRYRSAGAMADDLERYVSSRPVQAHPPSRWYRARKFMRRHRGGVAITALLALGMVASLAVALWQARVAQLAAAQARSEAARAHTLRNFMLEAFTQAEPSTPGATDATVVDVVERAVMSARADQLADPHARVDLLIRLAQVLGARGKLDRSAQLLTETQRLADTALAPADPLRAELELAVVFNLVEQGERAQARQRIDDLLRSLPQGRQSLRARALIESATIAMQQRDFARAERDAESAVRIAREQDDADLSQHAMRTLGSVLMNSAQLDRAIPILEQIQRAQRARYGGDHVNVAAAESALSRAYRRSGDLARAEQHARAAIAISSRALPADHAARGTHLNALAMILIDRRAFDEARDLLDEIVRIQATTHADPDNLAANLGSLGQVQGHLGLWPVARQTLQEALGQLAQHGRDNELLGLRVRMNLGYALAMNGQRAAGEAELDRALAGFRQNSDDNAERIATVLERKVRIALDAGDLDAAQARFDEFATAATRMRTQPLWPGRTDVLRAEMLLALGQLEPARQVLMAGAIELQSGVRVEPVVSAMHAVLRVLIAQRSPQQGESADTLRQQAIEILRQLPFPPAYLVRHADLAGLERAR